MTTLELLKSKDPAELLEGLKAAVRFLTDALERRNSPKRREFARLVTGIARGPKRKLFKHLIKADGGNLPPLLWAAEAGNEAVAKALLDAGANPNATYLGSWNALGLAAKGGHDRIVKLLLDRGAKKQFKTDDAPARPPVQGVKIVPPPPPASVQDAASAGDADALKRMLKAGADVNALDEDGRSALLSAILRRHFDLAADLLAAGADPNLHNQSGDRWTTLMFAIQWQRRDLVRKLIAAGADVNVVNREHQTALDIADSYDDRTSMRILRAAGGKRAEQIAPTEPEDQRIARIAARAMEDDGLPTAPDPGLSEAAKRPTFKRMVERLAKLAGAKPRLSMLPGVAMFKVDRAKANEFIARHQSAMLKHGAYLVRFDVRYPVRRPPSYLSLFATGKWEDVIALVGTNAPNHDLGSADIIKALRQIAKRDPFTLTALRDDTVEGQFHRITRDADALAKRLYKLCTDIVHQGTETAERLAEILRTDRRLFLWWD